MKRQRPHFSADQDELLIEYVRAYEELYDYSHKKYSDTHHKTKLWTLIGKKVQQDGQECKHRWESIRGQYRKMKRLKKTSAGQAADSSSKWKYEDLLEFLRPHMKDNERLTPLISDTSGVATDDCNESVSDCLSQDFDASQHADSYTRNELPTRTKFIKTKPTTVKSLTQPSASSVLMSYLLEEERKKKCEHKDDIDHFFDSIKATVKTFNALDKHLTKSEIFAIVSDIESKYVGQQSHTQHHPGHDTSGNMQNSTSYISPSATPLSSSPSSTTSLPQTFHSSAASHFENFSSQNNFE